jgi:predicted AAA+ superfamily ATPase
MAGAEQPNGAHLENLVLSDLLAWRDSSVVNRPDICYWRTAAGEEVGLVVERGQYLLAVEVKAAAHPRIKDARHLFTFREEYRERVQGCLHIHCGDKVEKLGSRILGVPWWRVI